MGDCPITSPNDFEESMRIWSAAFEFYCDGCEKNDLDSSAGRIPEGTGDTTVIIGQTSFRVD